MSLSDLSSLLTIDLFFQTLMLSTPLILGTLGAYISQKAGVLNLAIEGIMLIGALVGVLISGLFLKVGMGDGLNLLLTTLVILVVGFGCGLFIAVFHLKFKADIGLTGIVFNMFASGFTVYLLYLVTGDKGVSSSYKSLNYPKIDIPIIKDIPIIGDIISGQYLLTYVAIIMVFLMMFIMKKTTFGLRISAVGESPEAVTSVGLSEEKLKLIAISLSGALSALGGASLSMCIFNGFVTEMVAGRGFIAMSANTLGGTPFGGLLVSLLFAFANSLSISLQIFSKIPTQFINMIPYVLTLVALVVYSYGKTVKADRGWKK